MNFLKALWQFVTYLFWPQWGSKESMNNRQNTNKKYEQMIASREVKIA